METMDTYSNKIRDAYTTVSKHIVSGAMGPHRAPAWPFSILETRYLYSKFYPKELFDTIIGLENQGFNKRDIAKMFYGPSGVSHWLYSAIFEFEGLSRDEVIDFIKITIDIIEYWRKKDPFCMDWHNIIWISNEIIDQCNREGFMNLKEGSIIAKILGQINMIAWQYCILIQIGHRNYSHEFHGPYDIGNGELLFVREYFNLRPHEIWPFASTQNISFDSMKILEIYKDISIKIDAFNHVFASTSLAPHLQRFLLILDDSKVITENEVKNLLNKWTDIITRANMFIRNFTKKDFMRKVIEMKYWLLKPQKKILGKDWRAPEKIISLAKNPTKAGLMSKKAIRGQIEAINGCSEDEAIKKMTQMFLDNVYKGKMYF